MKIKKLRSDAVTPARATIGSAGYDLYACLKEPVTIKPGAVETIRSGIAIEIESADFAAFIFARSGLASAHGITLANGVGVIDSDYRGEIVVPIINHGSEPFTLKPKDRFAQMVVMPVCLPELVETDSFNQTERGQGGFGSTGI
ncbi:MAG: dUTP diphosphatase [Oscillospiraceae bacterium]|nr:dUTP diphosphatase [Oscillospiraceae bacterium]